MHPPVISLSFYIPYLYTWKKGGGGQGGQPSPTFEKGGIAPPLFLTVIVVSIIHMQYKYLCFLVFVPNFLVLCCTCIYIYISSSIRIVKYIGHGQFGTVNLAVWTQQYVEPMDVAVKICRAGANEAIKTKFLKEAAIMGQFHHPNVVKLYGVVTMSERVYIEIL